LSHSPLLDKYLTPLQGLHAEQQSSVLDLACGNGRNGLFLIEHNIPTTFADIKDEALKNVELSLTNLSKNQQLLAQRWQVDFEKEQSSPLQGKTFSAIMVFRYLHRSLFEQIKAAIKPGGVIIYETFTEQQAQFGRPKNPNFLLAAGELGDIFSSWEVLHSFEGIVNTNGTASLTDNLPGNLPDNECDTGKQAIAQLVAIKPYG